MSQAVSDTHISLSSIFSPLSPLSPLVAFAALAALAGCDTPVADAGPLFNREAWHHVDDPSLIDDDFEYVLDELPTSGEAKQVPTLRRVSLHPPYMPPTHDWLEFGRLQLVAHVPQWVGSVLRLISQPFGVRPSQFAKPALHEAIVQLPATQPCAAFARLHAPAHEPQCVGSVFRFTSQPLASRPSQSANPALQVYPHAPAVHVEDAFAGVLQSVLQPPQCVGSVFRFTSQPFATT